jgi:uncharacterized protein (DUF1800 family)
MSPAYLAQSPAFSTLKSLGRVAVAATLCLLLVEQPLLAEAGVRKPAKKTLPEPQIQGEQRVLHALNRFTFGPRPGDVAAVEKMGLNKWFEQQLNPDSIDDAKLDERLAEYPAMQLSVAELFRTYPGPGQIRAYADGRLALPTDPEEHAMVVDAVAFYRIQRKKQETAKAAGGDNAMNAGTPNVMAPDATASPAPVKQGAVAKGENALDAAMVDDQEPAAASKFSHDDAMRLVNLSADQRMQAILALPPRDLIRFRQSLRPYEAAQLTDGLSARQKEMLVALSGGARMVGLETLNSRMLRDAMSERQLQAVMTDFWLNHFNVYLRKNQQEPYLIPTYERDVIRPNALGNFETLLDAVAHSPAMLLYLDNMQSVGPDSPQARRIKAVQQLRPNGKIAKAANAGLNENYGRELMELHTLGVNGAGYTQADVTNVAKVFTGWGIERGTGQGAQDGGTFEFDARRHEPGTKMVLGQAIHEGGEQEGMEVLHMLATNPATAHFIAQKLAIRFVSDTPPEALVDHMAASFLESRGDIKTVLRTMFNAPEFWSPAVYRAKVKTPEEFLISAVRASGATIQQPLPLVQALDRLGMPFYGMQTPQGYSWMKDGWVGTGQLVNRMNFSLVLASDRVPGTQPDWAQLIDARTATGVVQTAYTPGEQTTTPAAKELRLERLLLGEPVSERTRSTVLAESTDAKVTDEAEVQFSLGYQGEKGNKKNPANAKGLARSLEGASGPRGGAQVPPADPQAAIMAGLLLGSPEFQRR